MPRSGPWSESEERELRRLWNEKTTDRAIAIDLDRTERSVAQKRERMGLVSYKRPKTGAARQANYLLALLDTVQSMCKAKTPLYEISEAIRDGLRRRPR